MIRLLVGHVLERLAELPGESVHCVVTSPPYYGLRDYGIELQVWPDGWRGSLGLEPTLDLYLDHMVAVCREIRRVLRKDGTFWLNIGDSYAAKNLMLIPSRLAIRLQDDGWYVRSEIVWAKNAPMPESITDRPTSAHEKIFLLTRSARYFYDAEAVKEEADDRQSRCSAAGAKDYHDGRTDAFNRYRPSSRNLRNVWRIPRAPFPEAHFATFPPELPRRCIMAGTSERGVCPKCGAPWARQVAKRKFPRASERLYGKSGIPNSHQPSTRPGSNTHPMPDPETKTSGWRSTCSCDAGDPIPATILDPFSGAGTTLLAADQRQRHASGIELNPTYSQLATTRIQDDAPLLTNFQLEAAPHESMDRHFPSPPPPRLALQTRPMG